MIPVSVLERPRGTGHEPRGHRQGAAKVINLEERVQQLFQEHHGRRRQPSVHGASPTDGSTVATAADLNEAIAFARGSVGRLPPDRRRLDERHQHRMGREEREAVARRVADFKRRYENIPQPLPADIDRPSVKSILRSAPQPQTPSHRSVVLTATSITGRVRRTSLTLPQRRRSSTASITGAKAQLAAAAAFGNQVSGGGTPVAAAAGVALRSPSQEAAARLISEARAMRGTPLYQRVAHQVQVAQNHRRHGVRGHPEATPALTGDALDAAPVASGSGRSVSVDGSPSRRRHGRRPRLAPVSVLKPSSARSLVGTPKRGSSSRNKVTFALPPTSPRLTAGAASGAGAGTGHGPRGGAGLQHPGSPNGTAGAGGGSDAGASSTAGARVPPAHPRRPTGEQQPRARARGVNFAAARAETSAGATAGAPSGSGDAPTPLASPIRRRDSAQSPLGSPTAAAAAEVVSRRYNRSPLAALPRVGGGVSSRDDGDGGDGTSGGGGSGDVRARPPGVVSLRQPSAGARQPDAVATALAAAVAQVDADTAVDDAGARAGPGVTAVSDDDGYAGPRELVAAPVMPGQTRPSATRVKLRKKFLFAKYAKQVPPLRRVPNLQPVNPGVYAEFERWVLRHWRTFKANLPEVLLSGRPALLATKAHVSARQLKKIRKLFFQIQYRGYDGFHDLEDMDHGFVPAYGKEHQERSVIRFGDVLRMLHLPRTTFTDIIFNQAIGESHLTRMTMAQFVTVVIVVCLFTKHELFQALFNTFDSLGSGALSEDEFVAMATTLNPKPKFAGNVRRALEEFTWDSKRAIEWDVFLRLNERFPMLCYPALELQEAMRQRTLGTETWKKLARRLKAAEARLAYMEANGGLEPPSTRAKVLDACATALVATRRQVRRLKRRGTACRRPRPAPAPVAPDEPEDGTAAAAGFVAPQRGRKALPQDMIEEAWRAAGMQGPVKLEDSGESKQRPGASDVASPLSRVSTDVDDDAASSGAESAAEREALLAEAMAVPLFVSGGTSRAYVRALVTEQRGREARAQQLGTSGRPRGAGVSGSDSGSVRSGRRNSRRKRSGRKGSRDSGGHGAGAGASAVSPGVADARKKVRYVRELQRQAVHD